MRATCLVDNWVQHGSLWGEHGVSFLIETQGQRVLFDAGLSGQVLQHNMQALKIEPASLDVVVLSHGHNDHGGGLSSLIPHLKGVPLWAHPEAFRQKYNSRSGQAIGIGDCRRELMGPFSLRLTEGAAEVAPGVWTSGEITERPYFEGRGEAHAVRVTDEHRWTRMRGQFVPDPYRDDLSLVLDTPDGLVVVCGCAHAGLLNILRQVQKQHRGPVTAIVGGTHLAAVGEEQRRTVVEHVQAIGSPRLYLNHCTGYPAVFYLAQALPGQVRPFGSGSVLECADQALV